MIELLKGKKVILYGDERYIRDFLYVFDNITPSFFIDDMENGYAKSYNCLSCENLNNILVIICKYDENTAWRNLESMGLVRGKQYVSATLLFELLDFPIRKIARERKVYIWGTGARSHQFFHEFVEENPDIEIVGCIDSDVSKKNRTFFRRTVYLPEDVLGDDNIFIIVASTDYWNEIREILLSAGKKEDSDFVHYLAINHWASWMIRETIYDIPRMPYVCPKAFHDASLLDEGRLSVCAGIPAMTSWGTPVYYTKFGSAWHSNVMKVLRLSMVNGTYSFCNVAKCNLLYECGQREKDVNDLHYEFHYEKVKLEHILRKGTFSKETVLNRENYDIKAPCYPSVVMCSYDATCNLYCSSCRKEVFSVKGQAKKNIDKFSSRLKKEVFPHIDRIKVAGNGETFASESYKNIIFDLGVAKNIKEIGILSNGTLFSREYVNKLASLYSKIHVFISMDGATKETAQKLRKGVDFEKWLMNMEYLGKMREKGMLHFLAFNFVVQKDNYEEMPEYVKMCLGFHADQIKFSKIFNVGTYKDEEFERVSMFDSLDCPKAELVEVLKDEIFKKKEVKLFEWVTW